MKNQADYSLYRCPFDHIDKECGHELQGPEGFEDTYGVWCACGFRGPAFVLEPEDLRLVPRSEIEGKESALKEPEQEWESGLHTLKTDPLVFDAVASGEKKFEIRRNDRNFQVGDTLILRKTRYTGAEMADGSPLIYMDRPLHVRVTHMLHGPLYGLAEGWVIMSTTIDPRTPRDRAIEAAMRIARNQVVFSSDEDIDQAEAIVIALFDAKWPNGDDNE